MFFSFTLKVSKILAVLQSFGSEFQAVVPLYAELLCQKFALILVGLRFILDLRSVLFIAAEMLKRLDKYYIRSSFQINEKIKQLKKLQEFHNYSFSS